MFLERYWDWFCYQIKAGGYTGSSVAAVLGECSVGQFIILKHDVETNPKKALRLAQIEKKHSLTGSYYVQASLLHSSKNIQILRQIRQLGHEVSYHHDVMDSNHGDLRKAAVEFQKNVELFRSCGFPVQTVCQHGNPVIARVGYSSNRDFFRDPGIAARYEQITELMVNFKQRLGREYYYISDAGYGWKIVLDPEHDDLFKGEVREVALKDLEEIVSLIKGGASVVISTHPHRWFRLAITAQMKAAAFITVKVVTQRLLQVPFMRKWMGRFYFLAKKI
jgi:hypothetical protein